MCAHIPRVVIRTPLVVIVHVHDLGRTSNTVRLLKLAIPETMVVAHGIFPDPADPSSHVPAGATPVVLFPGHGAEPLTPELVAARSYLRRAAPDESWRS